ncbi:sodium-dependent transporter [Halomonas sp. ISL-60]|uniref:sodium-dependent transporter n=1 Tax=unclassified Halomonas TaxID=2609666 RepID=UPI0007D909F5|nr:MULTISPECIES: sodium-dependent transporter [unclassified Halomonas]MBT2774931.1 sodium-dependent transporter [Halomonas sp. ISL-60]MBT2787825.1 sodium-dependent transporter [Halomonas sp. ISL-106]MBT2799445.1 sodium-dependent transporter [Halomonas sp. ISL-104]MBT2803975.1 sodium-dependent transporter [Halomonas sp. ISL-56]OAL61396.1 transporter [Halomonas sp. ALS9]
MSETLERWGSKRAFILAVTGAAVGLGNIWRFPYVAGENGGAAFLLIYVAFVLLLGIPVMMAEILIGRAGRRGPMQALGALAAEAGASPKWRWLGLFGAFTVFCILSFYSVVSGWSIEFLVASVNGNFNGASAAEIGAGFEAFLASPGLLIFNHSLFLFMTMTVVAAGVAKGLERLNNLLMPLLYLLLLLLAGYAATTDGFAPALAWLFLPSFEALTPSVVVHAMGHAFFTLAVGACALMAYGAYMPEEQSLPKAAVAVAVLDISVALLAGIAIFSVVFAQGMDPTDGPGLMFVTLPIAFSELPWGSVWLSVFFLLLLLATWTSAINLAEPMVATLQGLGLRRSISTAIVALSVWLIGLLSAFSFSTLAEFRPLFGRNVFELVSSIPPDVFLPLGGLLIAIFAAWVMPREKVVSALGVGESGYLVWRNIIRWVSIPLTFIVLLAGLL